MWMLYLSYYDDYGTFRNNKFKLFKIREKAEMELKRELDKFTIKVEKMIEIYNNKNIISEDFKYFDECEIENILSDNTYSHEEKIRYLIKECYCCSHIKEIELNMDYDIVLEHSFPP